MNKTILRLAALSAASVTLAACGSAGASSSGGNSKTLTLVAYSTPQGAYDALIAAFKKTPAGQGASVQESFGASGAQSRAVLAGQPADIVAFSLEPDMTKLVKANLVDASWNANAHKGIITDSDVVLVVRKGNPKNIHDWADLVKPGIKVVTPNPASSGSARWNIMAAYGAQVKAGKSPAEALAFVKALLKNTVSQPESGAKATSAFVGGVGDVLISYENEALKAQQAGQPIDFVTPSKTILIENPIAVTTHAKNKALATAFVNFLYTDAAQKIFASKGYRPVVTADLDTAKFPKPAGLFTISDLGGWSSVSKEFFDEQNGSIVKLEKSLGNGG